MAQQVKVTASLTARPGKAEELRQLLFGMRPQCRAEAGNLRWDIWQEQGNPDHFVLDELYRDCAAVVSHRATPHFQHYLLHVNDLAERKVLVLDVVQAEP
jgi:quinol monooxygenase YgiN